MQEPSPEFLDRRTLANLAAQLVVVFLGVWAAFLLEGWRQDRAEDGQRRQVRVALVNEIRGTLRNVENFLSTGRPFLEDFRSAVEAGEKPRIQPVHGGVRFTPHMWNATLETAGLDLLDADFVYDISGFYNNLELATFRLDLLRRYSREVLLPNLDRPAAEFYEEDGTLRPKYRWYLQYWEELVRRSESLLEEGKELVEKLERRQGGAAAPGGARTAPPEPEGTADSAGARPGGAP